jgi:hypothetical protein
VRIRPEPEQFVPPMLRSFDEDDWSGSPVEK